MRKFFLFIVLVTLPALVTQGQLTATIGSIDCSSLSYCIPWCHSYDFSESQYGIPASELVVLGSGPVTITELGWYCCSTLPTGDYSLKVYLTEMPGAFDLSTLGTNPVDNISLGAMVASGKTLTGAGAEKMLTLDTPFTYTPGNHLIVTTCDLLSGRNIAFACAGNSMTGNGMCRFRDGAAFDCNASTAEVDAYIDNMWTTTIIGFIPSGATYDLTILAPGGSGSGETTPTTGTWLYAENAIAPINAIPYLNSLFDYWELDGAFYSVDKNDTVLMDTDHAVQAFFKPIAAQPLPFTEDFTDVVEGAIPVNWFSNHTAWGVGASNKAGGDIPEMTIQELALFSKQYRLVTPLLDGTNTTKIMCAFKLFALCYSGSTMEYNFQVLTSTDGGMSWVNRWSLEDVYNDDVYIDLNDLVGTEFQIAFQYNVIRDLTFNNSVPCAIDDVYVGSPPIWNFNMLNPVGPGAVSPTVGQHVVKNNTEILLAALPSSTWYLFNIYGSHLTSFDPMSPDKVFNIAEIPGGFLILGATWADETIYITIYTESETQNLYKIDLSTGDFIFVGSMGRNILGLAYDEVNDILYGLSGDDILQPDKLYKIDRTSGATTHMCDLTKTFFSITYGDGVLYGLKYSQFEENAIYSIDVNTGDTTLVHNFDEPYVYCMAIEYDKDQNRLFLFMHDMFENKSFLAEFELTIQTLLRWGTFPGITAVSAFDVFVIPYDTEHPAIFDHWEVDGALYSYDVITTLLIDEEHNARAFFNYTGPTPIPTMGLTGIGILLLAVGALMSFARRRK